MQTTRAIVFGVFLVSLILAVSVVVLAKPEKVGAQSNGGAEFSIPAHAVEVAPGVFNLGTAIDVDGTVVEGFMFVHNKNNNAKPDGTPGGGNGKKEKNPDSGSTCYSHLAKGAKWKTVEDYIIGAEIDSAVTQASLEEWNTNSPVQIFGNRVNGVVDGVDTISPDNKNEVMFGSAGPNTIAVTTVWGIFGGPPHGRKLVEWDALFNSAVFDFGDANVEANPVMDYMNIAVHEFGHSAGMGHAPTTIECVDETMYPTASYDETSKRDLNAGDITGIQKLYN